MPEKEDRTKSLIAVLSLIQSEVGKIVKDGKNTKQGFGYVSEAQVKAKLQNKLAEHGIMFIPSYQLIDSWSTQSQRGANLNFVSVMGTFTLTNGSESVMGSMPGIGMDSGDKAIYKAETGAQKNFLMQLFLMSTGNDPDDDIDNSYNNNQQRKTNSNQASNAKLKSINEQISKLAELNQSDSGTYSSALMKHFPNVNFKNVSNSDAEKMIAFLNQQIKLTEDTLKQLGAI